MPSRSKVVRSSSYYQCFRLNSCFYISMQLLQQLPYLRRRKRTEPAVGPRLDARQPLPTYRIGDDDVDLASVRDACERLLQRREIMSIDSLHVTAERREFIF